jgi:hypothetical protein
MAARLLAETLFLDIRSLDPHRTNPELRIARDEERVPPCPRRTACSVIVS